MKEQRGEQVYPTLSLTSALDGDGRFTARPGYFIPWKDPVPIVSETGCAPGSGLLRKISPPPGFDLRTFQPARNSYTDPHDTDSGKPVRSKRNWPRCHLAHHKSAVRLKPSPRDKKRATDRVYCDR